MNRILFSLTISATFLLPTLTFAQTEIDDIAPPSSFLVAGFDDMNATIESVKSGQLWKMYQSEQMQEWMGQDIEDMAFNLSMMENELGLEEGSLDFPRGPVGVAMYTAMDDDMGMETMGMIGIIDCKDNEEMLEKLMNALVEKLDEDNADYDEIDLAGRKVIVVTMPEENLDDFEEEDAAFGDPAAMMEPFTAGFEKMYLAREGSQMLFSSNPAILEGAFDAVDGDDIESVGDIETYQDALAQVGSGDGHAVVLMKNITNVANLQPTVMMFGPMVAGTLNELGLADINAISMSMDLSPDNGVMKQTIGMLVDEKVGLVKLMDETSPRGDLPAFATGDTKSYSRMNFNFGGMMDVIDNAVATLPFDIQQSVEDAMLDIGPDLTALFNSLGNEIHMISREGSNIVAFRCDDTQKFEGVMSKFAPQMQLEPREFVGQTIYSGDFQEMAIGIGSGFAFMGDPGSVEMALRTGGDGDAGGLAEVNTFVSAMSQMPDADVVAWGWSDSLGMFQTISEPANALGGNIGAPDLDNIDPEELKAFMEEYVGPSIWHINSVESGYIMHSTTLLPADD